MSSRFPLASLLSPVILCAVCSLPCVAQTSASDPYLWLEQVDSPRALDWVRQQNTRTLAVLEGDPHYGALHSDALAVAQAQDRIPQPQLLDGGVFNFWQDAHHVRGIWRRTSLADYQKPAPSWQTVLDLDALAKAENANWVYEGADCAEPQETRCMVQLSDGGEDSVTVREFDVATAEFVAGGFVLPRGKQSTAWVDDHTLLVSREWTAGELTSSGYPFIVKRLARGQPLSAAVEIFRGSPTDGGYGVTPMALNDAQGHRALLIQRPLSTFDAEYYLVTPNGVKRLVLPPRLDIEGFVADRVILRLNEDWNGPGQHLAEGTLVALDLADMSADPAHLRPVAIYVPSPRETFDAAAATAAGLVVTTLDNVRGRASIYRVDAQGTWTHTSLALPDNDTIGISDADLHGENAFLTVSGFLTPPSLVLADAATDALETVKTLPPKFDASRDTVEQFEATSTDGTKIPYFVVHAKGMKLDGSNPTILYAYGGFQISETPSYSANIGKLWLARGGVYVLANIRGGGEFGPAWHDAGLNVHRQIVYDDFASVARDLFARNITSPRRLGIQGGSNGGLLMGVEFIQHPEFWHAVDIQVPLLDMLRFEKIAAGSSWTGEYGSVSVPEQRAFLAKISPYQNLHRGTAYPEALIWTTTKDDRVGPQHARKFAARLAEFHIPYLFYEVTEGGHGAGANLKERAHTVALELTYFTRKLME